MLRLIKVWPQYLLPQHALSAVMYRLARCRLAPLKDLFIRAFIRAYGVDMSTARELDAGRYPNFNIFFTRALRPEARPLAADGVLSPVDGSISQYGEITSGRLLQAKGRDFAVEDLLGGDRALAGRFDGGSFMTLYLAPPDYHRIHLPVTGRLQSMTAIPGRLFSVSPATTATVDGLFARNERIVNLFETAHGAMAVIMVGAIFVGSMETVWAGEVVPKNRHVETRHYDQADREPLRYARGQEVGRFNMGSTVILLFERGRMAWREDLKPGDRVKMGQQIGTLVRG